MFTLNSLFSAIELRYRVLFLPKKDQETRFFSLSMSHFENQAETLYAHSLNTHVSKFLTSLTYNSLS